MNFLFTDPIIEVLGSPVISVNWIITVLVGIVCFFILRTLNKMEKTMEALTTSVNDLQTRTKLHEADIEDLKDNTYGPGHAQRVAELIFAKLKVMQG